MTDVLDQLAQLRTPCDVSNDGEPCERSGAYVVTLQCPACQPAPEQRLVCAHCMTTVMMGGLICSACREPMELGHMQRLTD